jgi:hypothetical protein
LTDPAALLVVDASTVINLNALGCARRMIDALPNRVLVVDIVPDELERGRHRQRQDADLLHDLATNNIIEIVSLDATGEGYFEQLVIGDAGRERATAPSTEATACGPMNEKIEQGNIPNRSNPHYDFSVFQ